jgi:hypothetical protein
VNCDDGDVCTVDSCDSTLGCQHAPQPPAFCDDHVDCTMDECVPFQGCRYTVLSCDDGRPCTNDFCDYNLGHCVHEPIFLPVQTGPINLTYCNVGCSPRFWKKCVGQWAGVGFVPSQTLASAGFVVPVALDSPPLSSKTLRQALTFWTGSSHNGAAKTLLRAGVAGLLTASKGDYPLSATDVLGQVNMALATLDQAAMTSLAATLDAYNNLGCLDPSSNPLACLR